MTIQLELAPTYARRPAPDSAARFLCAAACTDSIPRIAMSNATNPTTFKADLSAGALMLSESRKVAALLGAGPSDAEWQQAIRVDNLLQKRSTSSAIRVARLIRSRLDPLGPKACELVAHGDREVAMQMLMAAALEQSTLLRAFVRSVLGQHHRRLEQHLSPRAWDGFLVECAAVDASVNNWRPSTRAKLRQVFLLILVEAGYLDSVRSLQLRAPSLRPEVVRLLRELKRDDVLETMELRS